MSKFAKLFAEESPEPIAQIGGSNAYALEDLLEEIPVSLEVFIRDKKYLGDATFKPSDIQSDAIKHIERIYFNDMYVKMGEYEPYWLEDIRLTNFHALQWGKGAGKDSICRMSFLRVAYLFSCLKNPQAYFGIPDDDDVHMLNVAMSAKQAQRAFFNPLKKNVRKGWFKDKTECTVSEITFAKGLIGISGHSETESQEGLNLLLGICDEIDGFKTKADLAKTQGASLRDSTRSAESIMNMMRSSGITRFPETFKQVYISFPRYLGSTIQQKTQQGYDDIAENGRKSRWYASGPYATWEVKPSAKKWHFAEEYKENRHEAMAKYECKPSFAADPYYKNPIAVEACFRHEETPAITVSYLCDGKVWRPDYEFSDDFFPIQGAQYAMHADLAVKGDRAGIAMAHVVRNELVEKEIFGENGEIIRVNDMMPYVKTDFIITFEADLTADPFREIQIRWARDLWAELKLRGFNIRQFSFDGYQCLSGDTEIPLLDGTSKTLRELEGSDAFWLYSMKDGSVVPGKCTKAWKTGFREDMLEVELDNGEVVRCTSDHPFMLRNGTYIQAQELKAGQSLMPLYRKTQKLSPTSKEYEQVWHPEPGKYKKHWRFTHSVVSETMYGTLPRGSVTHHKDCSSINNDPSNLVQLTNEEHSSVHAVLAEGRFSNLWKDENWAAAHKARLSKNLTDKQLGKFGRESRHFRHDVEFVDIHTLCSEWVSGGKSLRRKDVEKALNCTEDVILHRVKEQGYSDWRDYKKSEFNQSNNHKVVAIRKSYPEEVYDLQVEDYHNFAVSAGAFVHNSTESRQELERLGVDSPVISTDRTEDPWKTLRDLMYGGRVSMPYTDILRNELLGLTKRTNGKIDHTSLGSKDMADAFACACTGAIMLGGAEAPSGARAYYSKVEFSAGSFEDIPELKFDERDVFNMGQFGHQFDSVVEGDGWSDSGGSLAGWF